MVHCVGGTACTKGNKTIIMIGGLQHCSRQLTRKERKQSEKVPSIREEKRDLGRLWGGGCFLFFVLLLLPTTSLQLEFLKKKKKKKKREGKNRERKRKKEKKTMGKKKKGSANPKCRIPMDDVLLFLPQLINLFFQLGDG